MSTEPLDARISEVAARQHGVVGRLQLLELGLSRSAIQRRRKNGYLHPIHRGVYRVGPLESPKAAEMSAVLAGGPSALLSHRSAASLWGLVQGDPPRPVHITVPHVGRRRREGIVFCRAREMAEDERTFLHGIPITTPVRTIVDMAPVLGTRELELMRARAEDQALLSRPDFQAMVDRYVGRRGIGRLREILGAGEDSRLTRSEAERRCLGLIRAADLPTPHTNVPVGPYELDIFWPTLGIAIEIDGWAHHSSRRRFEGDRRKDNWLRSRGIQVIRLTWRQITRDATASAVQVGQAIALAGVRRRQEPEGGPVPNSENEAAPRYG